MLIAVPSKPWSGQKWEIRSLYTDFWNSQTWKIEKGISEIFSLKSKEHIWSINVLDIAKVCYSIIITKN